MAYKLINEATGKTILPNTEQKTFRGEPVILESAEPLEGANGMVYCRDGNGALCAWYPRVIGAKFVEE